MEKGKDEKKRGKTKKVFGAFNGHNLQKKRNKGTEKVIVINDDAQGDTSSSP